MVLMFLPLSIYKLIKLYFKGTKGGAGGRCGFGGNGGNGGNGGKKIIMVNYLPCQISIKIY